MLQKEMFLYLIIMLSAQIPTSSAEKIAGINDEEATDHITAGTKLPISGNVNYCMNNVPDGWRHVRHVPAGNTWHPATDQLKGTDVYGDSTNDGVAWSKKFSDVPFDQFMFATGDGSKWLQVTKT